MKPKSKSPAIHNQLVADVLLKPDPLVPELETLARIFNTTDETKRRVYLGLAAKFSGVVDGDVCRELGRYVGPPRLAIVGRPDSPELRDRVDTVVREHRAMWDMVDAVSELALDANSHDLLVGTFEGLGVIAKRMADDLTTLNDAIRKRDDTQEDELAERAK